MPKDKVGVYLLFKEPIWIPTLIQYTTKNLGPQWLLAGVNFPVHTTALESEAPIQYHYEAKWKSLAGKTINFDRLILDGENVVLLSTNFEPWLDELRASLETKFKELGGQCWPFPPLCHMTLARMSDIPNNFDGQQYINTMESICDMVTGNPVTLTVAEVRFANTYNFLTSLTKGQ